MKLDFMNSEVKISYNDVNEVVEFNNDVRQRILYEIKPIHINEMEKDLTYEECKYLRA